MPQYRKRTADVLLAEKLEAMGAVLIEGPKACGKTTTAEQQAKSILYMDDPSNMQQNLQLAETNIKRLLQGSTPRLIDEWQIAPKIWDATRYEVDTRGEEGQFILTGSAVPVESSEIKHSGTGRFSCNKATGRKAYTSRNNQGSQNEIILLWLFLLEQSLPLGVIL